LLPSEAEAVVQKMKKVGNNVCRLRKSAGIDRRTLAKRIGCSYQFVWAIETGKKMVSLRTAAKMATLFDTTVDVVFEGEPDHASM
jgi:DNA-binding XRE family transcriptional regulator